MRRKFVQTSLLDIYHSVEERLENNKPELFRLLDEHLDWDEIIPATFYRAFYLQTGRKRKYELESFLRALFLRRIFHYSECHGFRADKFETWRTVSAVSSAAGLKWRTVFRAKWSAIQVKVDIGSG